MRKALLFGLSAVLLATTFFGGAWFGQTRPIFPSGKPSPLSTAEARTLSDTELRNRILALVGDRVVEVSGVPPPNLPENVSQGLDQISLSLPTHPGGWPGLCSARVLAINLETGDRRLAETANDLVTVSDVRTYTVYKIVGPIDPNGPLTEPRADQCRGKAFADGYFFADNSMDASEAARFTESMRTAAERTDALPFSVSCGPITSCVSSRATLSALDTAKLAVVRRLTNDCPSGRTCLELIFQLEEAPGPLEPPAMIGMRVIGRYQGVGPQGWGVLRVESVEIR